MQQTSLPSKSRILIIGGGISGLALGQSLQRSCIPFTIFERDPSSLFRPQGYRVSHNKHGEESLKSLLTQEMYEMTRKMGTGDLNKGGMPFFGDGVSGESLGSMMALMGGGKKGPGGERGGGNASQQNGKDGHLAVDKSAPPSTTNNPSPTTTNENKPNSSASDKPGGPPLANFKPFQSDRTVLRGILGLDLENDISYGKRFIDFKTSPESNLITARFGDGSEEQGSLLIGGDGIRSKVNSQLLSTLDQPPPFLLDCERRVIYGKTHLTPSFTADFPEHLRSGPALHVHPTSKDFWLFMDTVRFSHKAEDLTKGKVNTPEDYIFFALTTKPSDFLGHSDSELFNMSSTDLISLSLEMTSEWSAPLRSLLENQDPTETAILRIQSAHPDIPDRPSLTNVTIMGDSIHAMSPTGGAGANTALRDAALLGKLLGEAWTTTTSDSSTRDDGTTEKGWREGVIEKVVQDYEKEMFVYSREILAGAFQTPFQKLMMGGKGADDYKKLTW